jgi:hypothetical protein
VLCTLTNIQPPSGSEVALPMCLGLDIGNSKQHVKTTSNTSVQVDKECQCNKLHSWTTRLLYFRTQNTLEKLTWQTGNQAQFHKTGGGI